MKYAKLNALFILLVPPPPSKNDTTTALTSFFFASSNYLKVRTVNPVGKETSTRYLKDVLPRQAKHLPMTSCRYPKDVLNANLKSSS